jgi:c-di-GMP-binding flagellar brake protein YcgR
MVQLLFRWLDAKCVGAAATEASTNMMERRKARRYGLCLPVTIRASIGNDPMSLQGETLDISTRGVYFTVGNELEVGMKLGLSMTVPMGLAGGMQVFLLAVGKVVRVEKHREDGVQSVCIAALRRYEWFRNGLSDNSVQRLSSLVRSLAQ